MTADVQAVNAKVESFSKKEGRNGSSYNTSLPSRVKEKVGKYAYNNGTLLIPSYQRSSINLGDLISQEMACYKK